MCYLIRYWIPTQERQSVHSAKLNDKYQIITYLKHFILSYSDLNTSHLFWKGFIIHPILVYKYWIGQVQTVVNFWTIKNLGKCDHVINIHLLIIRLDISISSSTKANFEQQNEQEEDCNPRPLIQRVSKRALYSKKNILQTSS